MTPDHPSIQYSFLSEHIPLFIERRLVTPYPMYVRNMHSGVCRILSREVSYYTWIQAVTPRQS